MKIKFPQRVVKAINTLFNFRFWLDWNRVKASVQYLISSLKRMFVIQKKKGEESFEQAQSRLKLTNYQLQNQQRALLRLSIVMLSMAFLVFIYLGYLLVYGNWIAVFIDLIVLSLALVLAFRYHFWYFQIKQRKLGCSFEEWFRMGLMREKK